MTYDNIKSKKNQRFPLSLEDTFFRKTTGVVKLTPLPALPKHTHLSEKLKSDEQP